MKYEQRGSRVVIRETGETVERHPSNIMARRALRKLETEHMLNPVPDIPEPVAEPEKHEKPKVIRRSPKKKKVVPE